MGGKNREDDLRKDIYRTVCISIISNKASLSALVLLEISPGVNDDPQEKKDRS